VESVLDQTCCDHEIILVDDGSNDITKDIISKFRDSIKYIYQENRGPSAARNTGIKAAKGMYLSFLDADDLWMPNKLEVQLTFMERHGNIGLVFSDVEQFNVEGVLHSSFLTEKMYKSDLISQIPLREAFVKLVIENFILTSTVMVRRECFKKAGMFDESIKSVEDRDLWLRIAAHFEIACLPLTLCKKRIHDTNISMNYELAIHSHIKVLQNNRRLFPNLAPAILWNSQLADLYMKLSYGLLVKNQMIAARHMAFRSLMHAITIRASVLILLTFMARSIIQSLLWIRKRISTYVAEK